MTTQHCFSTPIYTHQLEGAQFDSVQEEIAAVIGSVSAQPNPWAELGTTSFRFDGCNDLIQHHCSHTAQAIIHCVHDYLNDIAYPADEFTLVDSWFNWYQDRDFMFEHLHPNRRISGCYYYSSTGEDGDLKFRNPNPSQQFGLFPSDLQGNTDLIVTPRTGMLVLFPSWLWHRVAPNLGKETRISIAFNLA